MVDGNEVAGTDRGNSHAGAVALIGLPGSGKTTLGASIAVRRGWASIALGESLRQLARFDAALAKALADGHLAPEHYVEAIFREFARQVATKRAVLDGFPRHSGQLRLLHELFGDPQFLYLRIAPAEAVRRITERSPARSVRPEDSPAVVTRRVAESQSRLDDLLGHICPSSLTTLDANLSPPVL